jgi:amino acid adenylation domain-containing protein
MESHHSKFNSIVLSSFINQLTHQPEKTAFCIDDVHYSYHDLALEITTIRKALQNTPKISEPIGLIANDDLTTYASIWAIWLEGHSYVPLHPKQPKERNREIIDQAKSSILLNSNAEILTDQVETIHTSTLPKFSDEITIKEFQDSKYAYVLFTSGSTGNPKGVPITRGNLASFVTSFLSIDFKLNSNDRFLQCFDLTFDVSVQCFLIPLLHGASVFTIPHHAIKYSYVYGLLEDHQLTFATMAPSMVRYLQPYFEELDLKSLKYSLLTAEASYSTLIDEWSKCIPNASIYNFYGPTEGTIYCTYYKYQKNQYNQQINGILNIGEPMNGFTAVIIDENNNIITTPQKGELCISGEQVTSGYLSEADKNKTTFISLNVNDKKQLFYKTGDICYYEKNLLMYVGRMDQQVKIQGYRVELSEIEFHAREALKGKNTIAVTYTHITQTKEIALFIEDEQVDEIALKQYLKTKLPSYMIPSKYLLQKTFPLNSNGKIDRKTLALKLT